MYNADIHCSRKIEYMEHMTDLYVIYKCAFETAGLFNFTMGFSTRKFLPLLFMLCAALRGLMLQS